MEAAQLPGEPSPNEPHATAAVTRGSSIISTIMRMVLMYMVMSYFKGGEQGKDMAKDPTAFTRPVFSKGDGVDVYLFLNEVPASQGRFDPAELVWHFNEVPLAQPDSVRFTSVHYKPSPAVQNNGTLYMHLVLAKAGKPIDPEDPEYDEELVFGRTERLTTHMQRPKNTTGVNLLSAEGPAPAVVDSGPREVLNYIKPNMTIQIVDHFVAYPKKAIAATILPFMQFNAEGNHYPLIYFNDFWLLKDKLVPVNETLEDVMLHFDFGHIPLFWWQLQQQMVKTFETQRNMGMQQEGESDEIKRVFIEGNPYLLALTMVVSLFHTVFDMLAFKNDIGFWKNNKSMEGLSARSVLINAVCQLIILLYLFDNETSFVVLLSATLGTAIEFWKVTKAMNVRFDPSRFPYVKIEDRDSYNTSNTKKHDEVAMRYLSYALYPLVGGYAIYSLLYKSHKSWYSWVVSSLVGAVYLFGFILMCPQLYLNYKLKSVAHLPWRQMTYKFLNTIIDDLFAFVIKMPLLHRLSVFRDDLVFLVYIYQRWIYRVDPTRVNEFGYQAEPEGGRLEGEEGLLQAGEANGEESGSGGPAAAAAAVGGGDDGGGTRGDAGDAGAEGAGNAARRRRGKEAAKAAGGGEGEGGGGAGGRGLKKDS